MMTSHGWSYLALYVSHLKNAFFQFYFEFYGHNLGLGVLRCLTWTLIFLYLFMAIWTASFYLKRAHNPIRILMVNILDTVSFYYNKI